MASFSRQEIEAYCEAMSSDPIPVLRELERETHLKTLAPQMISGKLQGQFLSLISHLLRPKLALEIGTFTGYGSICIALGLAEGGMLHTLEANPELEHIIRKFLAKAGVEKKVNLHLGDALQLIPELEGTFDLVFMDAAKQDYPKYFAAVIDRVRPGGMILADNVLWSGKVLDPEGDADAESLNAFNLAIQKDPRVEQMIMPLRDGLSLMRRLPD